MFSALPTSAISSRRSNEQQLVVPRVATTKNGTRPSARSLAMASRNVSPRSLCSLSVSRARSNTPPSRPARSTDEWDSADEYATSLGTMSTSTRVGSACFMICSIRALAPSNATKVASLAVPCIRHKLYYYYLTVSVFGLKLGRLAKKKKK